MGLLFISDLHLSDDTPDLLQRFIHLMQNGLENIEAVYILGDLFEYWVGDDVLSQTAKMVCETLQAVKNRNIDVFIMHGNRDFLLSKRFMKQANAILLNDPYVLEYHGQRAVLTHGDLLCIDDVDYQNYRRVVRNPIVQRLFLCLPRWIRQKIASNIRKKSALRNQHAQIIEGDVNLFAAQELLNHFKAQVLIHGHTHRPFHYHYNTPFEHERIVLGDWRKDESVILYWQRYKKYLNVIE